MDIERFEQWLILNENKTPGSANGYRTAIGRLEDFYSENSPDKLSFLNASEDQLKELISVFETKGPFRDFGLKSNSTNINALRALLRYRISLNIIMNTNLIVKDLLGTPHFQYLLESQEFYFQKLTDLFEEYKVFDLNLIQQEIEECINNEPDNFNFQELLDNSKGAFKDFILLIGKMVAVFDEKGYNKNKWNSYDNNRVISRSMLSQRFWTYNLLEYKLSGFNDEVLQSHKDVAFKYSINFINKPEDHVNIVSKYHRKEIIEFFNLKSDPELIDLFSSEIVNLKNEKNRGVIISHLIYNKQIKEKWLSSITGLMASDSTGWFDNYIKESEGTNYGIIWNSKRPSGTAATLKFLRNILNNGDTFNIYYSSGGYVNYVATVIDFVDNKDEYLKKDWKTVHGSIYGFENSFLDYTDGKKLAKILFLIEKLEKIEPISVSEFKVYKDFNLPRQDNLSPIQYEPDYELYKNGDKEENNATTEKMNKEIKTPLNQILYGPPGTGKTYKTIEKAVNIVDPSFVYENSYKGRKELRGKYNELVLSGNVVFTTFHQSMAYEDFVEGIKPETTDENQVVYKIEDGLFKKLSYQASYEFVKQSDSTQVKETYSFTQAYKQLLENIEISFLNNEPLELIIKNGNTVIVENITDQGNIRLRHPNGNTLYTVSESRLLKLHQNIGELNELDNLHKEIINCIGGCNATVFWAVLNKVRDLMTQTSTAEPNNISYQDKKKMIRNFPFENYKDVTGKPVVLIIDEINRGNVSAIFGELITLLEPSKRLGNKEDLTVTLPYSKETFGVPNNLHVIGTMNTADRSVEALDTALRRRFVFQEMMPNTLLLKDKIIEDINLSELLEKINKRVEALINRDHTIGHSYFINVTSIEELKTTFKDCIIPLLQEYFYGDNGKIGLVLGDGFVKVVENDDTIFSSFEYQGRESLVSQSYEIIPFDEIDFKEAIVKLLA